MIEGIGLSKGIGVGDAFKIRRRETPKKVFIENIKKEVEIFENGIKKSVQTLRELLESSGLSPEQREILEVHIMLLEDVAFFEQVIKIIKEESVRAVYAVHTVSMSLAATFEKMENVYFRERAADMKDIGKQVIAAIDGHPKLVERVMGNNCIVVAHDLSPSDTAKLDLDKVNGFMTEIGGPSSHSAIIARSLGIPAIQHAACMGGIHDNDFILLDGSEGKAWVNPEHTVITAYLRQQEEEAKEAERLKAYKDVDVITQDGEAVKVSGNIIAPEVAEQILPNGGVGVGLFRSEFLYMGRDTMPEEEEQFKAYKSVLEILKGQEVVVRTLDVGGDKEIDYLGIPKEDNPFLGFRAIRYCLNNIDVFKVQIRALLRASHYGKLKIMMPMIGTIEETRKAKEIIELCKKELDKEGTPYDTKTPIGIMIEVPSAVMMSRELAREVDFFSIGTNDLIGYTMAADRMNSQVGYLYSDMQPSVLRMIQMVIANGHAEGIEVSMCGNSAANKELIPLYLGMGLDKFSVNPPEILGVKKQICSLKMSACKALVKEMANWATVEEVKEHMQVFVEK